MMKRNDLVVAAVMMFGTLTMAAQTSTPVKDDLFAGTEIFAKGASDVTEVTMDPQTLGLVGGKDSARAHRTVLNVVRTYSYDKPGMYKIEDVETFRNRLNTGDWHCSVHTRSMKTGESTDICNKQRTDGLSESAIITVEPKSLTFIHTIRRRNEDGSDIGGMPLGMLMGLHGLSSLAMLDPDSMVEMEMLKAQMGAGGNISFGTGSSFSPKTFMLDIPDSKDLKDLRDSTNKLKFKKELNGDVQKELNKQLNDAEQPYGDQMKQLPNKDKKSFLLVVPRAQDPSQPQEPAKPAPDAPSEPQ